MHHFPAAGGQLRRPLQEPDTTGLAGMQRAEAQRRAGGRAGAAINPHLRSQRLPSIDEQLVKAAASWHFGASARSSPRRIA